MICSLRPSVASSMVSDDMAVMFPGPSRHEGALRSGGILFSRAWAEDQRTILRVCLVATGGNI